MSSDGPIFNSKECIDAISKKMLNGQIKRIGKPKYDECSSPPCQTFKAKHNFAFRLKTNLECDSRVGVFFEGRFPARPNFTSTLTHGLLLNGEGRGAHHGKFIIAGRDGLLVSGLLGGITNAGTHTTPPSDCEPCNAKGHIEGRLAGKITKGSLIWGRMFASYMIGFKPSKEFNDTVAHGTLEGIIVRDCNKFPKEV